MKAFFMPDSRCTDARLGAYAARAVTGTRLRDR